MLNTFFSKKWCFWWWRFLCKMIQYWPVSPRTDSVSVLTSYSSNRFCFGADQFLSGPEHLPLLREVHLNILQMSVQVNKPRQVNRFLSESGWLGPVIAARFYQRSPAITLFPSEVPLLSVSADLDVKFNSASWSTLHNVLYGSTHRDWQRHTHRLAETHSGRETDRQSE